MDFTFAGQPNGMTIVDCQFNSDCEQNRQDTQTNQRSNRRYTTQESDQSLNMNISRPRKYLTRYYEKDHDHKNLDIWFDDMKLKEKSSEKQKCCRMF